MRLERVYEFHGSFVPSAFRIFDCPVKAAAQERSELSNKGLYEAASGTDGEREEPYATLCNLAPST